MLRYCVNSTVVCIIPLHHIAVSLHLCSGDIFQQHALDKLQQGSEAGFDIYHLDPSVTEAQRVGKLPLPSHDLMHFTDCSELSDAATGKSFSDRIWVPRQENFATIDLVLSGQRLANFTINQKHEILLYAKGKTQGLIPVATALGVAAGRIQFYWVMPRERYSLVRSGDCKPFPVKLYGAPPAASVANSDSDAKCGSATAPTAVADDDSVSTDAGTKALLLPPPKKPGRPKKQPAASDGEPSLQDDFSQRIDQFLLLVPFDVLQIGSPTPPT